jgi:hypothetical protein
LQVCQLSLHLLPPWVLIGHEIPFRQS